MKDYGIRIFETFVLIVFLFMMGMIMGWIIEVFYRHFEDKQKRWFNPGYCVGPWLPVYGFGLVVIYLITYFNDEKWQNKIILFLIMSICMTIVELIAGIIMKDVFHMELWDYSNEWLNYRGLICPKYSLFWMILAAIYYFLIHPHIMNALIWMCTNLIFSFVVGFFFAIFLVDVIFSSNISAKLRSIAKEKGIVVALEDIKERLRREKEMSDAKRAFFVFMAKEKITDEIMAANAIKEKFKDKVKSKDKEKE